MTTIDKRTDPLREERLDDLLATIARRGAAGKQARWCISADGRAMLDLLELAQRGLTVNTVTDSGHRYHNPPASNLMGLVPGRYVVIFWHVDAKLTAAGRNRLERMAEFGHYGARYVLGLERGDSVKPAATVGNDPWLGQ